MGRVRTRAAPARHTVIKAAGYARISVANETSTSIEQQSDAIRRFCESKGWKYDPKTDLYVDEGISGSKKDVIRPAFDQMLRNASNYDRIVVFRLDRLSRRTSELAGVLEKMRERNIYIVSASEGLSTDTDNGMVMANILGSLAAGEAEAIRQRVINTQSQMFRDGKWKGGARPYGWKPEPLTGGGVKLVLNKDEAKVLRKAVSLIIGGDTIGGTARKLNDAGHRSYNGTPFSPQALSNILRSEILIGRHVVNGRRSYGSDGKPLVPHEALITEDRWNQLQLALGRLRVVRPRKGGAVLAGVLRCSRCGGKLTGSNSTTNRHASYRCRNRYALMNGKCELGVSVKALAVEQLIGQVVLEVLKQKQSMRIASRRMRQDYSEYVREKQKLERAVEVARGNILRLREQNRRGLFEYSGGEDAFEEDFRLATSAAAEAEQQLRDLGEMPEEPEDLRTWTALGAIEERWDEASASDKNRVIRALIDHIVIRPRTEGWRRRGFDPGRVTIVWNVETAGK